MIDLKKMLEGFLSLSHSEGKKIKLEDSFIKPEVLAQNSEEDNVSMIGGKPVEEKPKSSLTDLTKKVAKSVSAVFTKGSKNGGMTIQEMTKEFEKRPREENQKEYEELVSLYEISHLEDDWLVLRALHMVLIKQI